MLFKVLGISGFPENGLCFLIQGEQERKGEKNTQKGSWI